MSIKIGSSVLVKTATGNHYGKVVRRDSLTPRDKCLLGVSRRFRIIYLVDIPYVGFSWFVSSRLEVVR